MRKGGGGGSKELGERRAGRRRGGLTAAIKEDGRVADLELATYRVAQKKRNSRFFRTLL